MCSIINSATGYFKEKNKIFNSWFNKKIWRSFFWNYTEIKTLNGGIGINTDDDLPLNKPLKFPTLTIIIRCVLQKGEKLYPQIYLDTCLYEIV